MNEASEVVIVYCTVPDAACGQRIASHLVEYRLAACVNIIPGVTSVYRWEERVETAGEALLMIKARRAEYPGLEAAIRSRHPYELPEIIAVSLSDGFAPYLSWIHTTTTE